jgi:hypothetical protein
MTEALKLIVDGYLSLKNREVLDEMRAHRQRLRKQLEELQAAGAASLRAIAAALNERGIPTARGNGEWSAVQVSRVLERIEGPFDQAA